MMKENITRKIESMEIGGYNKFTIINNKNLIEFKLFKINDVEFLAISGGGISLLTFFKEQIDDHIDYVMDEINGSVFKGVNLDIENSKFI